MTPISPTATREDLIAMIRSRDALVSDLKRAITTATDAERQRCVDIVSAARFGEVDRDFRALVHMIEGGRSAEEIKTP